MKIDLTKRSISSLFEKPKVAKLCNIMSLMMYSGKRFTPAYESNFLLGLQEIISTLRITNMRQLRTAVPKISEYLDRNETVLDRYFEMGEDFEYLFEIIDTYLSSRGKNSILAFFKAGIESAKAAQDKKLRLSEAQEDLTNSFLASWQASFSKNKHLGLTQADRLKMLEQSAKALLKVARNKS